MNEIEYQCPKCKSKNIQAKAWVHMNDIKASEIDFCDNTGDVDDYWCMDCESHMIPEQVEV